MDYARQEIVTIPVLKTGEGPTPSGGSNPPLSAVFRRFSRETRSRITRLTRIAHRFAMAHNPAHKETNDDRA